MTFALDALIREASTAPFLQPCTQGLCAWESEGGRACPQDYDVNCSQAVYRCTTCGAWDYGDPGGPGARDCATDCLGRRLGLTPGGEPEKGLQ